MSGCLPIIPDNVETRLIASLRWFYYGYVPEHDIIAIFFAISPVSLSLLRMVQDAS